MRKFMLNVILVIGLAFPLVVTPVTVMAAPANACPDASSPQGQALQGIGKSDSTGGCNDSGVNNAIKTAVNILGIVVGAAGIIMVIVAGFKYITSGGDQQRVANSKSTLIYALIGLAIAALAQVLVHFVLNQANSVGT